MKGVSSSRPSCFGFSVTPCTLNVIKIAIVAAIVVGLAVACIFSANYAVALAAMGAQAVTWGTVAFFAGGFGLASVSAIFVAYKDRLWDLKKTTWSIVSYIAKMVLFPFYVLGYAAWRSLEICGFERGERKKRR